MKKPKLSGKERMPSPFEPMAYKVERSAVAVLMHWMRGIIEQKALDLGLPDVETLANIVEMLQLQMILPALGIVNVPKNIVLNVIE
ncbi:hypothetical protein M1N83_01735 [Dehalococcoidia bacterium]|nr:hypothetical protein [Dehalococcoidia bacterium]